MATSLKQDLLQKKKRTGLWQEQQQLLIKENENSALVYGRIPPQANELEEAVLGAIMLERDKLQEVLSIIPRGDCFYVEAHKLIYNEIRNEEARGMPIDLLTVTAALSKSGNLQKVGGAYFLTKLTMDVATSAHVEAHARIVMEKHFSRELIKISGHIINEAYDESNDVFNVLDFAEQKLSEISGNNISQAYKSAPELAREVHNKLLEAKQRETDVIGVDTGFQYLNVFLKGWQKAKLIVIGARPAMGKTAFALNILLNAIKSNTGVGYFSLEMGSSELSDRLLSAMSGIQLDKIITGRLSEEEQKKFDKCNESYSRMNVKIDDSASLSMMQLRSKARKMVTKDNVGLIIIDYLQLMESNSSESRGTNREQVVAQISKGCKRLAKELGVPVFILSQLNRDIEKNKTENKVIKPKLSDLRESGAIEQDADIVLFLYGPKKEDVDENGQTGDETKITRFVSIAKNRAGTNETVKLQFNQTIQKFSDFDESFKYGGGAFIPVSSQDKKDMNTPTPNPDDLPF